MRIRYRRADIAAFLATCATAAALPIVFILTATH